MMSELQVSDLFGAAASEDSNQVAIAKADLAKLGLDGNELESIAAAIILQINEYFQGVVVDDTGDELVSPEGLEIGYDLNNAFTELNSDYQISHINLAGDRVYEYTVEKFNAI